MGKLFGTDGVRGKANVYPMTTDMALRIGRASAHVLAQKSPHFRGARRPRIVIGKDTRLSGYMFETALSAGICSAGVDVLLVGPLPTPGIAFITHSMRADAGVVISASHNGFQDNGIKFFAHDGFKLPDEVEEAIEAMVDQDVPLAQADQVGRAARIDDAVGRYIVYLKNTFPRELILDGLKVVVDCANGAAYRVAPAVFKELGARVFKLGVDPDGLNINVNGGSLHTQPMCDTVVSQGADLGISLDGDADRVIFSDEKGHVVDGDQIMAICATRMLAEGSLAKNTLVATVMSNIGLEKVIAAAGGTLFRTAVGDRYVVEAMRHHGYNLGGEQSGHLIFLDSSTTGDGVVAALRVLAIMLREGRSLSDLAKIMTPLPQILLNVQVRERPPLESVPSIAEAIARVQSKLSDNGRVLVRYSGTELKARVMIEGEDEPTILAYAEEIAQAIRTKLGA